MRDHALETPPSQLQLRGGRLLPSACICLVSDLRMGRSRAEEIRLFDEMEDLDGRRLGYAIRILLDQEPLTRQFLHIDIPTAIEFDDLCEQRTPWCAQDGFRNRTKLAAEVDHDSFLQYTEYVCMVFFCIVFFYCEYNICSNSRVLHRTNGSMVVMLARRGVQRRVEASADTSHAGSSVAVYDSCIT